jgi:hypothetical protein
MELMYWSSIPPHGTQRVSVAIFLLPRSLATDQGTKSTGPAACIIWELSCLACRQALMMLTLTLLLLLLWVILAEIVLPGCS